MHRMQRTKAVGQPVDAAARMRAAALGAMLLAAALVALLAASCANVVAPSVGQPGAGGASGSGAGTGTAGNGGGGGSTGGVDIDVSDAGPRPETGPTEDAN